MRSALASVSRTESISAAWRSLFERASIKARRSSGIDEESLRDFDRHATSACREISRHMRGQPGYQFSKLKAVSIPKDKGGYRIICVPTVRDRIVQRTVNGFLAHGDRCGLANEVSFGFIPNRSVEKAVQQARILRREKRWVYKTDIAAFFDSIDRSVLRGYLYHFVRDRSLLPILVAASECEIDKPNRSTSKKIDAAGIRDGRGVRQGMPLSPFFANLLLKRFDQTIQQSGISMVRYADDLVCFATSEADCVSIHGSVGEALDKEGLKVPAIGPESKSKIYGPEDSAEFLGLELRPQSGDYLLEVPANQCKKIRQRILGLGDLNAPENQAVTMSNFVRRLDGLISGFSGAYEFANNAGHLEAVLDAARIQAIETVFSGLGVNVNGLSLRAKRFFGIVE